MIQKSDSFEPRNLRLKNIYKSKTLLVDETKNGDKTRLIIYFDGFHCVLKLFFTFNVTWYQVRDIPGMLK